MATAAVARPGHGLLRRWIVVTMLYGMVAGTVGGLGVLLAWFAMLFNVGPGTVPALAHGSLGENVHFVLVIAWLFGFWLVLGGVIAAIVGGGVGAAIGFASAITAGGMASMVGLRHRAGIARAALVSACGLMSGAIAAALLARISSEAHGTIRIVFLAVPSGLWTLTVAMIAARLSSGVLPPVPGFVAELAGPTGPKASPSP